MERVAPRPDEDRVADDDERPHEEERSDDPGQPAPGVVEPVPACIERDVQLAHGVVVERHGRGRCRFDALKRGEDALDGSPGPRAVVAFAHPWPLLVDDGSYVRTDRGADAVPLRWRKRTAVPHDRGESIRLAGHVALRVGVVLVGDDDDEREQQTEQCGDDTEHLRRDLRVESLGDRRYEPSDRPDEQQHEPDESDDDRDQEEPDRQIVDGAAQHERNRTRDDLRIALGRDGHVRRPQAAMSAATRPDATASSSAR